MNSDELRQLTLQRRRGANEIVAAETAKREPMPKTVATLGTSDAPEAGAAPSVTMVGIPWTVLPEELPSLDADIIRSIAGEVTEGFMNRVLGRDSSVLRRRLVQLLRKHSCVPYGDLAVLGPERRRRLAESIVRAELAERDIAAHSSRPMDAT